MINKHIIIIGLAATLLMAGSKDVFTKHSLDEALSIGKKEGKGVLVKFHADWCHFCNKMDRVTFTNKKVRKALVDYIPVKIDVDTEEGINFAKQYRITALPTIMMFDKNGKKVYHQTGFHSAKQLEEVLKMGNG